MSDPKLSTHNVQVAAQAKGAQFMFHAEVTHILQKNNRVTGVLLKDGTHIGSKIVINVAGPHSSVINQMAALKKRNVNCLSKLKARPYEQPGDFEPEN